MSPGDLADMNLNAFVGKRKPTHLSWETVSVFPKETEPLKDIYIYKEMYYNELAHTIIKTDSQK